MIRVANQILRMKGDGEKKIVLFRVATEGCISVQIK